MKEFKSNLTALVFVFDGRQSEIGPVAYAKTIAGTFNCCSQTGKSFILRIILKASDELRIKSWNNAGSYPNAILPEIVLL